MALSSSESSYQYVGNNSTVTPYAFPYRVTDASHIHVFYRDNTTAGATWFPISSGFVDVVLYPETGTAEVTLTQLYDSTYDIRIDRDVPVTQPATYPVSGPFPALSHETALDRACMIDQQQERILASCLKLRTREEQDENTVFADPTEASLLGYAMVEGEPQPSYYTPETLATFLEGQLVVTDGDDATITALGARVTINEGQIEANKLLVDPVQIEALAQNRTFGVEYAYCVHARLIAGSAVKVLLVGDSTTVQGVVASDDRWANTFPAFARRRGFGGVTVVNNGHDATSTQDWLDTYLASDIAEAADVVVVGYGINDPFYSLTIAQTVANIRAGLTALRAAKTVLQQTIILCLPSSTYDPDNGRVPSVYQALLPYFQQAARDFQCVFVDKYSEGPDAENAAGLWMDDPYADGRAIHPFAPLNYRHGEVIANLIFPEMIGKLHGGSNVENVSGTHTVVLSSQIVQNFGQGLSIYRAETGWPYNGVAVTMRSADDVAYQMNFGYDASPGFAFRTWNIGGTAWNAWSYYGGNYRASVVPASGYTIGAEPMQTDLDGSRVVGLGYITMDTPGTVASGTTIATVAAGFRPAIVARGMDLSVWDNTNWEFIKAEILADGSIVTKQAITLTTTRIYFGGSTWLNS